MTKRQRRDAAKKSQAALLTNQQAVQEHSLNRGDYGKKSIHFNPKTESQRQFVEGIRECEVSVGIGPAGVGKTFCAATIAAQMMLNHDIDKIVLTRANVTVGKTIGMLPGTLEEKMTPLLLPILTVLRRQLGDAVYEYAMRKKKIEMLPLEYVRGMSFMDTFVIVDEAQNMTPDEVKALCTRYESGRIVLLGDPTQHDLKGVEPGIQWLEGFSGRHDIDIPVTRFEFRDVVRSDFVKNFLIALHMDRR